LAKQLAQDGLPSSFFAVRTANLPIPVDNRSMSTRVACWRAQLIDGDRTLNETWLIWGLLFGSIGLGYFVYGKKQRAPVPLVCGLVLMIFPYFVSSTAWLVIIGFVVITLPYFVRV
jgi:hypothetical protein